MTCPKCQGLMRTFDRMGVHIEQCERCRGVFLDAGELEQVAAAEQRHYGAAPPYNPSAPAPGGYRQRPDSPAPYRGRPDSPAPYRGRPDSPGPYRGRPDSPGPYGGGGGYGYSDSPRPYGHDRHRRKSFLENLFD